MVSADLASDAYRAGSGRTNDGPLLSLEPAFILDSWCDPVAMKADGQRHLVCFERAATYELANERVVEAAKKIGILLESCLVSV